MPDRQKLLSYAALLAVGFLFGASTPLMRIVGQDVEVFSALFLRFAWAMPFAALFFLHKNDWRAIRHLSMADILPVFLLPLGGCLFYLAVFETKISLAVFSFYAANLISSVIAGRLLNHETITGQKLAGFLVALLALGFFTAGMFERDFDPGLLYGCLAGISQTAVSLHQKRLAAKLCERTLTLLQLTGAVIFTLAVVAAAGDDSMLDLHLSSPGLWVSALTGFIFFLINYFMIVGFKHGDIAFGTLLMSSELIFGPLAAYVVFSEALTAYEAIGGALIILAVILVSTAGRGKV